VGIRGRLPAGRALSFSRHHSPVRERVTGAWDGFAEERFLAVAFFARRLYVLNRESRGRRTRPRSVTQFLSWNMRRPWRLRQTLGGFQVSYHGR
jgi:hypothetical protein